MTLFVPKKINNCRSCGEKLLQARLEKGLSLEYIGAKINIRPEYLKALEDDNFEKLPAGLYGKKFIEEYSRFLKLNKEEIIKDWSEKTFSGPENNPFSRKVIDKNKFFIFPKLIKNLLIILLIIICFLYLIFYFKKIVLPPNLLITQPTGNLATTDNLILITGETEPESEVKINGEIVLNNDNGKFSQTIHLKKGLNNITIKAKKKYSQEETVSRQILVE